MKNSLLAACLAELVTTHGVPGAQFAVHHGGATWTWNHGLTRVGTGTPMTTEVPVPVGSITKVVTSAAAMVLVDDGDLELDEPLAELIPELREPRLTLRHVLSHTGGLPCDPADTRAVTPRRHVLDCCRTLRPLTGPGEVFSYSNIGYLLAGHAVTAVTGMSWWEAVTTLVLDPLGVPSRFIAGGDIPTGLVSGHSARRRPVVQSLRVPEAAAGAFAASALDLVTLGRGLLATGFRDMWTPVPGAEPFGLADGWGLGLATYRSGDTAGHDGNGDGTSCHLRLNPATGTVVALTTNSSSGFALWRDLAPRLARLGLPIEDYDPLAVAGPPVATRDEHTGDYANGDLEYSVRHNRNGGLRLTVDGAPFADLTVHSGHEFTMRDCDTGVTDQAGRFVLDRDGRVAGLQVGGRLARKLAGRERLVG
ncbi:serine hydrolase domain-containing protein [Actinophytocola oryzae]|uniref:CubicO group peptidase (Beta-lactamase class C family) n=1 Tax=Actinophytocola oryzae TaxID=502181 RepID=A0A4R7W4C9_9PSEU|nr:serine hydrolase domain-containing protein [Actinophytocola oryzae]TDV57553.1 CubicO group peptidase (beta-lactamase class C family) [Actinophytocola oryzae]